MAIEEAGGYCDYCQRSVLGRRQGVNHVVWALFSIFTCGFLLLVWAIVTVAHGSEAYACPTCGRRIRAGATGPLPPPPVATPIDVGGVSTGQISPAPPRKSTSSAALIGLGVVLFVSVLGIAAIVSIPQDRPAPPLTPTTTTISAPPSVPPMIGAAASLSALPTERRLSILAQIVRSSAETCPAGASDFLQGSSRKNGEFWSLACSDGRMYEIQVMNDANRSTKVMTCSMVAAADVTPCFKKFPAR